MYAQNNESLLFGSKTYSLKNVALLQANCLASMPTDIDVVIARARQASYLS